MANGVQLKTDVLRDPRYPVSRIADALEPYLRLLVEHFAPEKVILFGSYAWGEPDEHSDVDLLIVKPIEENSFEDAVKIRAAWRPLRRMGPPLSFDLIVESRESHEERLAHAAGFYDEIVGRGLELL